MKVLAVVAPALSRPVGDVLDVVGDVTAKDAVDLVAEVDARLEEVGFEDGAQVAKGTLLFRLDDARLQAQLAQARANHTLAEATLKRITELRQNGTVPQQDLDQAEATFGAAEAALALAMEEASDARVQAPFDGVVSRRLVSAGQYVTRGQPLATLVRIDPLEVVFHVPERFAVRMDVGQAVEFHHAGGTASLPVTYLAPRLDPDTRTLEVKAGIQNPERKLRPGMFGRVRLTVNVDPQACVVPAAAVILSVEGSRVVVMDPEGRAEFRPVTTGRLVDDVVEITHGLKAGERVVVEGHQKLGPGMGILLSPKSAAYGLVPPEAPAAPQALEAQPASDAPQS